jgi:hypothetical protein
MLLWPAVAGACWKCNWTVGDEISHARQQRPQDYMNLEPAFYLATGNSQPGTVCLLVTGDPQQPLFRPLLPTPNQNSRPDLNKSKTLYHQRCPVPFLARYLFWHPTYTGHGEERLQILHGFGSMGDRHYFNAVVFDSVYNTVILIDSLSQGHLIVFRYHPT